MGCASLGLRLLTTFIFGVLLTAAAIWGLIKFQKAEWFSFPGPFPHGWAGYTRGEFNGLMIFTYATPMAFGLLFTGFQYFIRSSAGKGSRIRYLVAILVPVFLLVALIVISTFWSAQLLQCGILGCVNTADHKWEPYVPAKPEASMGWRSITALMTTFGALALLIGLLANLFSNWSVVTRVGMTSESQKVSLLDPIPRFSPPHQSAPENIAIQEKPHNTSPKVFFYFAICVVFFTFCFFTTTYIPNNWEYWTPSRIAQKSQMRVTDIEEQCKDWPTYHCPEYTWAFFRTILVRMTDYWNLHLFPGNMMFYAYIIIVPFFMIFQQYNFALRSFFSKKIRIQYRTLGYFLLAPFLCCCRSNGLKNHSSMRPRTAFFSINEILWIVLTIAITYSTFHYWHFDHNFVNYWPYEKENWILFSERIGRAFGQVAVLFFSFLMFPAARNSPMYAVLGLSWEGAMKYHRWLGVLFLLFSFLHMAGVYWWYYDTGNFPRDLWAIPNHLTTSIDNFTVPHLQWIFWMCLITLGVLAGFDSIRRKRFELFLFFHHVSYLVLIPALLWHATASWEFMLPGCVLWVLDRAVRVYRSTRAVFIPSIAELESGGFSAASTWGLPSSIAQGMPGASVVQYGQAGEIIELVVDAPGLKVVPGHFIFMNIAEVSLFEWHPFTVSSSCRPDSNFISFHIKTMGEGSWTSSLAKLIKENAASGLPPQQGLTISLDGPHGTPVNFKDFDNILLVSGGIGITPCKAIFESMFASVNATEEAGFAANKRVHFLSVARDPSLFHIMRHTIESVANCPSSFPAKSIFSMGLYATQSSPSTIAADEIVRDNYVDEHNRFSTFPAADKTMSDGLLVRGSYHGLNGPSTSTDPSQSRAQGMGPDSMFFVQGLEEYLHVGIRPDVGVELTNVVNPAAGLPKNESRIGRSVAQDLESSAQTTTSSPSRTLLFVCGPEPLVEQCESLAITQGWTFHSETFLL